MFGSTRTVAAATAAFALVGLSADASAKEYKLARLLNQVTAGETLVVAADVIEPGKTEYLIRLVLQNVTTDRSLIMHYDELQCWRGENQSNLKHASFGIGERQIDLMPGEVKIFPMLCQHGLTDGGDFKVNILHVTDSTGATLFDNVGWSTSVASLDKKLQTVPPNFVPKVTDHLKPAPAGSPPPPPDGIVLETAHAIGNVVGEIKDAVQDDPPAPAPTPAP